MIKKKDNTLGYPFWIQWVLANTVGWIVGMALFTSIGKLAPMFAEGVIRTLAWGVIATIAGVSMGINQWFVLNLFSLPRGGRWARWWVVVTTLAWVPSMVIVVGLGAGEKLNYASSGAVIGISMGIAQWFVMRKEVQRAEWWAVANTIGWMTGMAGIDLIQTGVGFLLAGIISGIITGGFLLWLLRQPNTGSSLQPPTG